MRYGGYFPALANKDLTSIRLKFKDSGSDDSDSDSGGGAFGGSIGVSDAKTSLGGHRNEQGISVGSRPKTSGEAFASKALSKVGGGIVSAFAGPAAGALASKGIDKLTGGPVAVNLDTGGRISGGGVGSQGATAQGFGGGDNSNQFQTLSGGAQVPATGQASPQSFGSGAIGGAVSEELTGLRESIAEQQRQFDIGQQNLSPFREAGVSALGQQQALLGLSGTEAQQTAFDQFNESPGQAFLRKRGQKALLAGASATGGLGGGNVQSALQQQGIGFAQQQLNQQQAQLAGISGTGQSTAVTQAQLGSQFAGNVGQLHQGAAQSRASGLLAQQALEQQQRTADSASSAARREQNIGLATTIGSAIFDLF